MKSKRSIKKIRRNMKNANEISPAGKFAIVILVAILVFIAFMLFISAMNNNEQYNQQVQTNYQNNISTYSFKVSNLYPANLYGEIGNGVFANMTQYDQYRILIGQAGTINMTFIFPQNADAQVSFNIVYLGNNTGENLVMNGLNGVKQISGQTIPSILTITVKNYGKGILNGEINATIKYG